MNNELQSKIFPILETNRLILRELRPDDAQDLFAILAQEEVVRYYDVPAVQLERVKRNISRHRTRFINADSIRWGITLKGDDKIIGNCGYMFDLPNFYALLSYVLDKPYWGQGLMTEALTAIMLFGFEYYKLNRFEAHVAIPNVASSKVLTKLGFKAEGILRERMFTENRFQDETLFSLLKSDWLRQQ